MLHVMTSHFLLLADVSRTTSLLSPAAIPSTLHAMPLTGGGNLPGDKLEAP
ncbi:hypothetical protein GCM10023237_29680 [Streptomyces coeruleoprunus]